MATAKRLPDLPTAVTVTGGDWLLINQGGVSRKAPVSAIAGATSWSAVTGKPTTVGGYAITDAYTKTEVTTLLSGKSDTAHTHSAATTGAAGFMSAADKTKLDGVAAGANNYTLPAATATTLGGIELASATVQSVAANAVSTTAARSYGLQVNAAGQAVVNVPWTDTVYTHPDNHPASLITQDANNRFVTDAEKAAWFMHLADIGSGVDLNTLTATGWYHQNSNAQAAAGTNYPVALAGLLNVYADGSMVYQTYQAYNGSGFYTRAKYNTSWSSWVPLHAPAWSAVTGKPTTISGYAITDAYTQADVDSALSGKEASIAAGSTAQFWRGDKTWQDLFTQVRSATLAGLSTATNAAIAAADTVLGAFGKLQAQITAHVGAGAAAHAIATASVNGFMSSSDKSKLDGVATGANNYAHPASHPASIITQDASNRFVTDLEKAAWNAKADLAGATFTGEVNLPASTTAQASLGIPHGVAPSAPVNGDVWTTTAGLYLRLNGTTRVMAHTATWSTVSQAEAEAGTANSQRFWTAQRVNQAVAALAPVKSVAGKTGTVTLDAADVGLAADQTRKITISTAQPTGGSDGDLWFVYAG